MTVNRYAVRRPLALFVSARGAAGLAAVALSVATACSSSNAPVPGTGDGGGTTDTGAVTVADASTGGTDAGAGGGGDATAAAEAGAAEAGAGGGDAGDIVVTSPGFADGQAIPDVYTCAGADTSPEIDWTAGPAGTLSYAVVVSDLTATANIHWVVWDLPPSTRSLPATLPAAATLMTPVSGEQVDLKTNPEAGTTMNGYFGPCPRGALHNYEFAVHAMDVAMLPDVTTMSTSPTVKAAVLAHSIDQGTLDGTSSANLPTDAGGQ